MRTAPTPHSGSELGLSSFLFLKGETAEVSPTYFWVILAARLGTDWYLLNPHMSADHICTFSRIKEESRK